MCSNLGKLTETCQSQGGQAAGATGAGAAGAASAAARSPLEMPLPCENPQRTPKSLNLYIDTQSAHQRQRLARAPKGILSA